MTPDERVRIAADAAADVVLDRPSAFVADLNRFDRMELRAMLLAAWTRGARFMVAEIATEREPA